MKKFNDAEILIIKFGSCDIITTSIDDGEETNPDDWFNKNNGQLLDEKSCLTNVRQLLIFLF